MIPCDENITLANSEKQIHHDAKAELREIRQRQVHLVNDIAQVSVVISLCS